MVGTLPYDDVVTEAMVQGEAVTVYEPDGQISLAFREMWAQIRSQLNGAD